MTKVIKDKINSKNLYVSRHGITKFSIWYLWDYFYKKRWILWSSLKKNLIIPTLVQKPTVQFQNHSIKAVRFTLMPPLLVNKKTFSMIFLPPSAHQSVIIVCYLQENF